MASDPGDPGSVFGLSGDLSDETPAPARALFLSKSIDGGRHWQEVARVDPRYYDRSIAEGLRNGLAVLADGSGFILTTQRGAFFVQPGAAPESPRITRLPGPVVPDPRSILNAPKRPGDPLRASVVVATADSKTLIVGYGYFDLNPRLFRYRRLPDGSWTQAGEIPGLPTDLDLFSMQFEDPASRHPRFLYVGTGDQAFRLDLRTGRWIRIEGVGQDSSIHSMATAGGPHFAACWGVYEPRSSTSVYRVTQPYFLLHRALDEVGPNIRAYSIEVDPRRHAHQVVGAITGAYSTSDGGRRWRRLNSLPDGEFHTAHFNPDGSVIVSGFMGTFVLDPFREECRPQLQKRPR